MTIDTTLLRRKTAMLREVAAEELTTIQAGKRRHNGSFKLFCEPVARGILDHLSGSTFTGPHAAAEMLVGLLDLFEGYLRIVESCPDAADRMQPSMLETAAMIHASVQAVSAPLPKIVRVALNGKRRRQRQ